ncbi:protein SUPPRESSOR OF npr1-1, CONSTITUTIVE 1-like, partial [Manihot esculenta]|uniref:protein SUPPRESSOR OF npr1-1, CONSTITUTIVE 1-like n=1 Tax=Manihot esculenta TaxID=3983 RepID=UPI001CC55DC7
NPGFVLNNFSLLCHIRFTQGFRELSGGLLVGLPGREIPEWFSFENPGSSLAIVLPPCCVNALYISFAFCVVLEFEVPLSMNKFDHLLLTCGSHLKNTDGNEMFLPFVAPEISHESMRMETTIESDHVFLWHNHYCSETRLIQKFSNVNELLMEFEFKAEHNMYSAGGARQLEVVKLKVKRCGVHLMYVSKDEEYQCSQSTIHSQHCLQYAATDSEFMQQVIETAHTNKKRSSDQANIITDGRLDKRLKDF